MTAAKRRSLPAVLLRKYREQAVHATLGVRRQPYSSWPYWLIGGLILILLAACSQAAPPQPATPAAAPTATPDPAARLALAGEAMMKLQTTAITISRSGGSIYLDSDETLIFNEATGYYQAPSSLKATVKVLGPGIALEMGAVQIGDQIWLTNPLTGQWEAIPSNWEFDMLALFSEERGWKPLLRDHVRDVELVDETTFGDATRLHLRAVIDGEQARVLTAGISGSDDLAVDFWVDATNGHLVQLQFDTPSADAEAAQWRLVFADFDQPVTIEAPQ